MADRLKDTSTVAGVVLAAGAAQRFGGPKVLLEVGGRPMVRRAVEAAVDGGLEPIVVVAGANALAIHAALDGVSPMPTVIENDGWDLGVGSSIAAGVRHCPPSCGAVAILLADQPFVTAELVRRVIEVWRETPGAIVRPVHEDRPGHPVLFDRHFIPELADLGGDAGGASVIRRHPEALLEVHLDSAVPLLDVDTPEDYEKAVDVRGRQDGGD